MAEEEAINFGADLFNGIGSVRPDNLSISWIM